MTTPTGGNNPLEIGVKGRTKTDLTCTECDKRFVASLDHSIDGNHVIKCPWCSHEHCRKIENGKVTDFRWSSTAHTEKVPPKYVWKSPDLPIATTTASIFIRDRWLNRSDSEDKL